MDIATAIGLSTQIELIESKAAENKRIAGENEFLHERLSEAKQRANKLRGELARTRVKNRNARDIMREEIRSLRKENCLLRMEIRDGE